ncbi:unnamed protein product [Rotaria sp. Silwood2]|nr:unnamed protein product [Rotaria sp. Silwood2]CAF2735851.1 unnamed protein product [Rotaria sp. Silwood2]CAF2978976.1 unnamed protein product [Rotaria sp. Silwood2]CAF3237685.1 unnamed protein product [Rotaria sp. Silwood2]CAF4321744.1 unnamed protein product [Rotaria sp. Silwood2]
MQWADSKVSNVEVKYTQIFINNEWHKATNGKTFSVINPSTGEEICQVEEGTRADVDKAVEAARKAFDIESSWRNLDPVAHANLMRKFAALLRRDIDYLSAKYYSQLIVLIIVRISDSGIVEVIFGENIDAGWVDKIVGETISGPNDQLIYTRHEPIGVCGQIIPW